MSTESEYNSLLKRLYERLPNKGTSPAYQEIPRLIIVSIGPATNIKNFTEFCDRIRRDPKILMKYLLKELAVPGSLTDNGQLELQGKFSSPAINALVERFIKTYVQCQTCRSLDTVLKIDKKVWSIQCLACGAVNTVKAL